MKIWLPILTSFFLATSPWAQTTTYTYVGPDATTFVNFTAPCGTGPCANFPPGTHLTGQFTTAAPLSANLPGNNISAQVTSFSFTDGLNTYSSADPDVRVYNFTVATDAGGNVTLINTSQIVVERWQTGSSPHAAGDRYSLAMIWTGTLGGVSHNNAGCTKVGVSIVGAPDTCTTEAPDVSTSTASAPKGTWTKFPVAPVLNGASSRKAHGGAGTFDLPL